MANFSTLLVFSTLAIQAIAFPQYRPLGGLSERELEDILPRLNVVTPVAKIQNARPGMIRQYQAVRSGRLDQTDQIQSSYQTDQVGPAGQAWSGLVRLGQARSE
ncbi:hypothetical protein M422DRAFT_247223 [Sphaerobolus stellatus SS14]|nr:hypothetical protein M422DRAFT_247223 [Sphaerobolus stellatus SS14]